jgi:hypothetical protein
VTIPVDFIFREELENRLKESQLKEEKVEEIESELKAAKQAHADAMKQLSKLYIYEEKAKNQHNNSFFDWVKSEREGWEGNGKQYNNLYWEYKTTTFTLKIRMKHRHDLKIWKHEVYVSGFKVHFEDFSYRRMHERKLSSGWCDSYSNFLVDIFPESILNQRFKTHEEALHSIENWKCKLLHRLSKEIQLDQYCYQQALHKYQNSIRIQLNHESAKAFNLKLAETNLEVEKEDYWNVVISGESAKETVHKWKKDLNFSILAG